ncbi:MULTISPECIES: hypothetical protein [Paraburkholderia]|uniref:Uncharacterized protein n=1 Tax=Paraburkholderia sacchari TaxID=159450 RepID=A0A8T6ZCY9_9BURK|nr:hypothetical protein [Paraburkholderia sacchari]NLP62621.1 hypothetical protein [Paraburkholderia sacchari]
MKTAERSLRLLVEKWIGASPERRARVTGFGYCRKRAWRYVRVETANSSGVLSILFFRHEDGSWCVFPPERRRPAMRIV